MSLLSGPAESGRSMHMRKLILGLLRLLITASLFLSGCGLRPCLHTTTGCETDNSEKDKLCRECGGPTTGCQQSLDRTSWPE